MLEFIRWELEGNRTKLLNLIKKDVVQKKDKRYIFLRINRLTAVIKIIEEMEFTNHAYFERFAKSGGQE